MDRLVQLVLQDHRGYAHNPVSMGQRETPVTRAHRDPRDQTQPAQTAHPGRLVRKETQEQTLLARIARRVLLGLLVRTARALCRVSMARTDPPVPRVLRACAHTHVSTALRGRREILGPMEPMAFVHYHVSTAHREFKDPKEILEPMELARNRVSMEHKVPKVTPVPVQIFRRQLIAPLTKLYLSTLPQ